MKRTPEEKLLNPKPGSKIAAAKEFGIDLTLLVENLRLTPDQRVRHLQQAMYGFDELIKSSKLGKKRNDSTRNGAKVIG
ncbi:MAG: hypothetical protein IPN69_16630 [Acidobacteria bacterium]|nr:hypothetical protein [Acidobacteriota bacterium]MBK8812336.1 hypothetical protein [Acidobacteriota bacterium]